MVALYAEQSTVCRGQPDAITSPATRRAMSTVCLFPVTCRVTYAPSMIRHNSLASERGSHGARLDRKAVDDVLDRLLVLRRGDVGRFVRQRKLHRDVDEDAALKVVGFDDVFDDIEQRLQLAQRRGAAALLQSMLRNVSCNQRFWSSRAASIKSSLLSKCL